MQNNSPIENVSDTALWVAVYRARESKRSDALFHDRLAERLAGERGEEIAKYMSGSPYTEWTVVIRTPIIDRFVQEAIADGVDTILNLGCGLDTRPYRLDLPKSLRWIEVDFPHMIDMKNRELKDETPRCLLERLAVDLSDDPSRSELLAKIAGQTQKVLVITEGVIPYLTQAQVSSLAKDLRTHKAFRYWLLEYFSPSIYRHLRSPARLREMQNAPFRFFPEDWFEFFARCDWHPKEIRYIAEESVKLGRQAPFPWWAKLLNKILPEHPKYPMMKSSAYVMLEQT